MRKTMGYAMNCKELTHPSKNSSEISFVVLHLRLTFVNLNFFIATQMSRKWFENCKRDLCATRRSHSIEFK